jgi:voltage-gated potassium channel
VSRVAALVRARDRSLPAIALLLEHQDQRQVLPDPGARLHKGDQILFCGREEARYRLDWTLRDLHRLRYLATGVDAPEAWVWRWAARLRKSRAANRQQGNAG